MKINKVSKNLFEIVFHDDNGWGAVYLTEKSLKELKKVLKAFKFERKRK